MLLPNSEFMADYCSSHITGSVPARVVYPPLNVDVIGEPAESRVEVVSMVGTGEKKGTHVVHALAAEFPQLRFRVVGYPGLAPGEELERGNLTLVGWCDVQAEFRKRADLVLVPSLWEEPFGRVAIEALAAGKWLLVSDIGGLREAVSYQAELMAPAGDLVAWREKLAIMVEEPERCRTAWRAAASEFESFKAERQIDALAQALTELTHWQKST
ncbi:glycosyltransferase [Marinobacter hydrocarbonoclasticus]|nr:glycosyltransferase [Marinobacter nauticus]MBY6214057.1 glycosyltransferase [Marinobacter nauticus]